MLSQPGLIPTELDTDPVAIHVTPRVLEIFINNVCNLSCVYCKGDLSSRINQENKKFGKFEKNGVLLEEIPISNSNNLISSSLSWLDTNYQQLERLHFLGGEPLVQKELDLFLEFLQKNKNSKLEVNIITNLMVSESRLKKCIQIFQQLIIEKRIKRLDITCSIDSWGNEQEFVRYGLNLKTWERNFNLLLEIPWLVLHINQTITNLTIKQMPTLIKKLIEWRNKKNVGHCFSTVTPGPSYMIPSILGSKEFAEDFEKILKLMPRNTSEDEIKFEYMQGIAKEYLQNSQIDRTEIKKLYTFLNEIDRRRNTDWQSTFPWLLKYKEYVV
jgi:organic radical activating enzyme